MNNQFDELTKSMAQSVTRRAALKKFGVGLADMAGLFRAGRAALSTSGRAKSKFLSVSLGLLAGFTAQATVVTFQLSPSGTDQAVGLSPLNEVPIATGSSGSGNVFLPGIAFDTTTTLLQVNLGFGSAAGFTDLTGAATAVHIRGPAPPGTVAPVLVDLQPYYFKAADPTKGGVIFDNIPWPTADIDILLAGLAYLNICTASFPNGEIRAQLIPIDCSPLVVTGPGQITAECGTDVTLTGSATGTGSLTYQWYVIAGEPHAVLLIPIPGANGPSLTIAQARLADTRGYVLVVTESCGSVSSNLTVHLTIQDTTPPALSLPANITANATSSKTGAVVTFQASALDSCEGTLPVVCTPPSGSTFPIGVTTVNCSANDGNGNVATGTFTVRMLKPHQKVKP